MIKWTKKAEIYFESQLEIIKKNLSGEEVNQAEVIEDIKNDINEKVIERKLIIVTETDIEEILHDMGFKRTVKKENDKGENISKEKSDSRFIKWLFGEVLIFGKIFQRIHLLLTLIFIPIFLIIFGLLAFNVFRITSFNMILTNIIQIFYAIFFIACLPVIYYILVKLINFKHNIFIICAIILVALSFALDPLLNFHVFPKYSILTIVVLCIVFVSLFISLFYKYLPAVILSILSNIMVIGVFVCIPFIVYLIVPMLISWVLIPFLIGLLTYSPVIALASFILSNYRIIKLLSKENKLLFKITIITNSIIVALIFTITALYFIQFKNNNESVKTITGFSPNKIYDKLPSWIKLGQNIPNNFISETWLKNGYDKNISFGFRQNNQFEEFDILSYFPSTFFPNNIDFSDREKLLNLLFNEKHVGIERLWDGNNLETKSVEQTVQIYPENHIAYTEAVFKIVNNNKNTTEEAIYTISLPKDSVATKLSLWIDGKEEPGILTLKSKAKEAYNDVVGVQMRDPSILEWIDGNRLRLKVFPVAYNNPRTVKIGFITPLFLQNGKLVYQNMVIEGQNFSDCKFEGNLSLFTLNKEMKLKGENISFTEKISSDNEFRQFSSKGKFTNGWSLTLDNIEPKGVFSYYDELYSITDVKKKSLNYFPENIYVLLDNSMSKEKWKVLIAGVLKNKNEKSKVILVNEDFFSSVKPDKINKYIDQIKLTNFHLFPFYRVNILEKNLIITNYENISVNYLETKESEFYKDLELFFTKNKNQIYVASLSSEVSKYFKSFEELQRITVVSDSESSLFDILKTGRINVPELENTVFFKGSAFSITKSKIENSKTVKGNDLIPRLYYYKNLMNLLGQRYFDRDSDQKDLLLYANDAMIVTPVSSFVVLEKQSDYDKHDIKKIKSKFDTTNVKDNKEEGNKLGLVPEPHEWALIIILIFSLAFFYRKNILKLVHRKI